MTLRKTVFQVGRRLPAEPLPGYADIRTAAFRIITRERLELNPRRRIGHPDDSFSEFSDRHLVRIAEIDRTRKAIVAMHESGNGADEVVDITERPGLAARRRRS